eukprot:scaffold4730_cov109-Isochrysis_galbana.AAC.3
MEDRPLRAPSPAAVPDVGAGRHERAAAALPGGGPGGAGSRHACRAAAARPAVPRAGAPGPAAQHHAGGGGAAAARAAPRGCRRRPAAADHQQRVVGRPAHRAIPAGRCAAGDGPHPGGGHAVRAAADGLRGRGAGGQRSPCLRVVQRRLRPPHVPAAPPHRLRPRAV